VRTVHAVLHLDGGPRGDEFDPDRAQSPASLQHRSDNKYRRRRGGQWRASAHVNALGLIPAWWKKPPKDAPATFNARAETVATKPMFRAAFKSRRCIVPASGFYEWATEKDGKQPHFFSAADGSILGIAGLWERWREPGANEDMLSATIIVTSANEWMRRYHDRMPVTPAAEDYDGWLSCASGAELFDRPGPRMREWRVSKRVNRVGNDDDPTLIEPIDV